MDEPKNLCLSCGICCDGTLIGFVQLDREEVPRLKELFDIENANGDGVFLQPCKHYCDGCNIYSKRPKQCGIFKCGLLKSYEQKRLDFDTAKLIINEVKRRRIEIERKLALLQLNLKSQSFYFNMVELNNLHHNKSRLSSTQTYLDLISELKQLDSLLVEKFDVSFS